MGHDSELSKESLKHKVERVIFAIIVAFTIFGFQNCSLNSIGKSQVEKASPNPK